MSIVKLSQNPSRLAILVALHLAGGLLAAPSLAAPALSGGSISGSPSGTVDLPISFASGGSSVSSLQFTLTVPVVLSSVSVSAGSVLTSAGKNIGTSFSGTTWTFIVYGLNQGAIASGTLLTLRLKIAANATSGALMIPFSGVMYANPAGSAVAAGSNTSATVTVTGGNANQPPETRRGKIAIVR